MGTSAFEIAPDTTSPLPAPQGALQGREARKLPFRSLPSRAREATALALVAALAFSPAVYGPFLLDDTLLISENPRLGSLSGVLSFFSEPVEAALPGGLPNLVYRPLTFTTLALERALWGPAPVPFHVLSLLFHVASTLALLGIARRLWPRGSGWPLVATLGWAILPIHAEAVGYIAARHDVLSTALYLAALLLVLEGRSALHLAGFCLLLVAAFLAKESAVSLPAAALLLALLAPVRRGGRSQDAIRTRRRGLGLCAIAMLCLLLALRLWVAGGLGAGAWRGGVETLRSMGSTLWLYARILSSPFAYSVDRSLDLSPATGAALLGLTALSCAVLAALPRWKDWRARPSEASFFAWKSRFAPRRTVRASLFLLGWSLAAYLPVSGVLPLYTTAADRYLYLPLAPATLAALLALSRRVPISRRAGGRIAAALALTLLPLCLARSLAFTSEQRLYEQSLQTSPRSPLLHNNLGKALEGQGALEAACAEYKAALDAAPGYAVALFNLGSAKRRMGELSAAEEQLAAYTRQAASDADGWLESGLVALSMGEHVRAMDRFEKARSLRPGSLAIEYHLAVALCFAGDRAGARCLLAELSRLHPGADGEASRRLLAEIEASGTR